jgi:hypothetical protein
VAHFAGSTPAIRRELERAWGQLVRSAGSQGLQLEPPQFDDDALEPLAQRATG